MDGLREESRQVFLDLACFFHGSAQDKVVRILESLDYEPQTEIQMLSDSFFIEVCQGQIFIPNFIQAMGQQMERTRIWIREDLHTVFDEHVRNIFLFLFCLLLLYFLFFIFSESRRHQRHSLGLERGAR